MIYYTKCCNFRFIGMNHSPEFNGICRNCGGEYIGEKEQYEATTLVKMDTRVKVGDR